jgi:hypothetical protein
MVRRIRVVVLGNERRRIDTAIRALEVGVEEHLRSSEAQVLGQRALQIAV